MKSKLHSEWNLLLVVSLKVNYYLVPPVRNKLEEMYVIINFTCKLILNIWNGVTARKIGFLRFKITKYYELIKILLRIKKFIGKIIIFGLSGIHYFFVLTELNHLVTGITSSYPYAKAARKDVKSQEKAYCAFFASIRTAVKKKAYDAFLRLDAKFSVLRPT